MKLLNQIEKYSQVEVVSFDIFDTLLFRTVKNPTDIFEKVAMEALKSNQLPQHITPKEFKRLRVEAEKRARHQKDIAFDTREVSLDEIYNCMPTTIKQVESLKNLEIEIEVKRCYVNPEIAYVIECLKKENKKIILTSDMYLPKEVIIEILKKNQMTLENIDDILMSCEILKSKQAGDMFEYLLEMLKITGDKVIHIGDNHISDVINPRQHGINSIAYEVISGEEFVNLQFEELKYGTVVPEVYAIRRYATSLGSHLQDEDRMWFNIGAMTIGPLLTGVAEWVLDTAEENNIKTIFPLMREGRILASLLQKTAKYREKDFKIEPMYVSRKSIFLPSMQQIDEKTIEGLLTEIKGGTIGDLFSLLHIESYDDIFKDYLDIKLKEAKKVAYQDKNVEILLKEYLLSEEVQTYLNQQIQDYTELAEGYMKNIGIDKEFITIDIGFKGTIQKGLERMLKKQGMTNNNIHLLVFGANECIDTIFQNVDIRGYVGSYGANEDLVAPIFWNPCILEQLMMCDEGTTTGYKKDGETYRPQTKLIEQIDKKQLRNIQMCQEGILTYQQCFLEIAQNKEEVKNSVKDARGLTQIVSRLLTMPTVEEACYLGRMNHDDNYGSDNINTICKQKDLDLIKEKGVEFFCKSVSPRDVLWLEGLVVQSEPTYYINRLVESSESHYEKSILDIVKRIVAEGINKVVIIGAGQAGRMMYRYLKMYHIEVEAFIDNNKSLQGNTISGLLIKAMQEDFESKHYVIGSLAYVEELVEQVKKRFGETSNIYYYGKEY